MFLSCVFTVIEKKQTHTLLINSLKSILMMYNNNTSYSPHVRLYICPQNQVWFCYVTLLKHRVRLRLRVRHILMCCLYLHQVVTLVFIFFRNPVDHLHPSERQR